MNKNYNKADIGHLVVTHFFHLCASIISSAYLFISILHYPSHIGVITRQIKQNYKGKVKTVESGHVLKFTDDKELQHIESAVQSSWKDCRRRN